MSLPVSEEGVKSNSLSIPEILADFFLRKIDMPSHSDDSDHQHKSKKRSKHKKRKHKKTKHRHRNNSSDSSSRGSELNTKNVVEDVSSSEEMGIKRLKKIKNMKLKAINKSVLQTTVSLPVQHQTKDETEQPNSSNKECVFYGPSLDLLLSGVESNSSNSKLDITAKLSFEDNVNINSECALTEDSSAKKYVDAYLGLQNGNIISSESLSVSVISNSMENEQKIAVNVLSDTNNTVNKSFVPLDAEANNTKVSVCGKTDIDCKSNDKSKSVIKQNNFKVLGTKQKSRDKKKKCSRSCSRSKSRSKHSSPKSKHKKRVSRSSSRDSYNSYKKKKRYSHSRSHSQEKLKSHGHKKSHSRSRSRSKYIKHKKVSRSQSPEEKCNYRRSRSRNRSYSRHRKHSKSRMRRRSPSRHRDRSLSKSRYKSKHHRSSSHSRSRSRSRTKCSSSYKEKSRSRSKEKKSSSQSSTKIDQAKILETARKNVLKMMKNGTLPDGLPVENIKKEQFISIQAGGKSVQELTDFCQRLSQKENDPEGSDDDDKDKPDDKTGFIHHPFKVKEPGMIKLNIKNAIQLPIKTHAQKVAETCRLSSQFPVSSGNQHKQKELEWIPVVPEISKPESKSTETTISTSADTNKTVVAMSKTPVSSVSTPVSSIPMPISYPCPSPSEAPKVEVSTIVPTLMPPLPPPPLPPPLQPPIQSSTLFQMPTQPVIHSYIMPSQQMISYASVPATVSPSTSVFKPPKKLNIPSIVAKRFQALTKLQQNPNDPEALKTIQDAQESIQEWVQSQQVPGLFTGSTDAKVLSAAELCGPKYHKFRKDILSHAPPVTEGKGMSLLKKMGWNPGEGLGKNKEGSLEPLMLDIKMDKKGLVSEGENSKKGASSFTKELQGKHPVSALMELCSKRRWKPPLYSCVIDHGPPHRKLFCFKVEVNGIEYQPLNPCSNKKVAKADAAVLCLQSLNILPKNV